MKACSYFSDFTSLDACVLVYLQHLEEDVFLIRFLVKPGQSFNLLFVIDLIKVDLTGESRMVYEGIVIIPYTFVSCG